MGKVHVKGGTPVGSESLCRTCSWAIIMTGYKESEMVTMCTAPDPNIVIPFRIYECTRYYDKNRPSWQQMEKLAISVDTAPIKPVGFKTGAGFQQTTVVRVGANDDDDYDEDE
jgi:hypothetical protein